MFSSHVLASPMLCETTEALRGFEGVEAEDK